MTAIDFQADPATARRYRVVSLVTHADIPDIVWADDETGCYGVLGRDAKGNEIRRRAVWADQDRHREEVTMPDRDMLNLGIARLVANACKGARIPRERREAPNPRYLLGAD